MSNKFLYFDCFAGIDTAMMAGALIDMTGNGDMLLSAAKDVFPDARVEITKTNVNSMEALRADIILPNTALYTNENTFSFNDDTCTMADIAYFEQLIINAAGDTKTKRKLADFINTAFILRSDFKRCDIRKALLKKDELIKDLCLALYIFDTLEKENIENVYCSCIKNGDAMLGDGFKIRFIPDAFIEYCCLKKGVKTVLTSAKEDLISFGAVVMLSVLNANYTEKSGLSLISCGYGAGNKSEDDIKLKDGSVLTDILRACIYESCDSSRLFGLSCEEMLV